jgi:outer membrane protein OmpA-like peptidoglycan-associated protein
VATANIRPHEQAPDSAATSGPLSDLRITFKLGSAELTEHGKAQAHSFAKALLDPALAEIHLEIAGHTDASGTEALNLVLSQARANSVRDYLVSQGVSAARLTAKGYGSQDLAVPSAPNDPANRRVEARRLD